MNEDQQSNAAQSPLHELQHFRSGWWVFLLLGSLLTIAGIASIAYPFFTTLGVMVFLGVSMLISGALMIVSAFWIGKWSGSVVQILAGLFYAVGGFIIADRPVTSAAVFTLMIGGFLIVTGVFRIMLALTERFTQWGWTLGSGVLSLLMGMIILKSFRSLETMEPQNIVWIIGLIIGVELISAGFTFIMLSFGIKRLPFAHDQPTSIPS